MSLREAPATVFLAATGAAFVGLFLPVGDLSFLFVPAVLVGSLLSFKRL